MEVEAGVQERCTVGSLKGINFTLVFLLVSLLLLGFVGVKV